MKGAEISLRSAGLCNLTEVVVRADDTEDTLRRKVVLASILGTIQSTFTDFRYVRKVWKRNAEEERLLGVSLTGIFDNALTCTNDDNLKSLLQTLRHHAVEANVEWASRLGINRAAAVTCVKPSGTVSQLAGCSAGIHPPHSAWYIRGIRQDNKDPVTALLKAEGVPSEPELFNPDNTTVFYFPVEVKGTTITRDTLTPIDHLELWKTYNEFWAEHQVSITVSVDEDDWLEVGAWVYKNFDHLTGVSFLPMSKGSYKQAPYQECSKEDYEKAVAAMPAVDWKRLQEFEKEDTTTSTHELACVAGACEIDYGDTQYV